MADLSELKRLNPILEIIQETDFEFSKDMPGLLVDSDKGRYTWKDRNESGDVFQWLINRYDWNFGQAVRYLENRLKVSPFDRMKITKAEPAAVEIAEEYYRPVEVKISPEAAKDWRIREARRIASDFPVSIDELLSFGLSGLTKSFSWIPRLYIPVIGEMSELDFCSQCLRDFGEGWQDNAAFIAVGVGNDYEILSGPGSNYSGGVYCRNCVDRFRRWIRALDLVSSFLMSVIHSDVGQV